MMKIALNYKVHNSLFVLTCLLLGAVVLAATVMAWDVLAATDKVLQQGGIPGYLLSSL